MKQLKRTAGHIMAGCIVLACLLSCGDKKGNSTTTIVDSTAADSMSRANNEPAIAPVHNDIDTSSQQRP